MAENFCTRDCRTQNHTHPKVITCVNGSAVCIYEKKISFYMCGSGLELFFFLYCASDSFVLYTAIDR